MQDNLKRQLTERVVELVEQINQQMHCHPMEEWEGMDLTIPQIKTLSMLQHQGPQRMGSISQYLGGTLSSATSIIDRLVDKELVERIPDPADRRVVICQLTRSGFEAVEQFWRIGRMRIEELCDCLTVEEMKTVVRAMELLMRAAQDIGELHVPMELSP